MDIEGVIQMFNNHQPPARQVHVGINHFLSDYVQEDNFKR